MPVVPTHAGPEANPEGTTTALLVVGFAGTVLGGGGWGAAARLEYQQAENTALGVELTAGVADGADTDLVGNEFRTDLIGIRGYGRHSFNDYSAVTYGAGLTAMGSGSLTIQLHAGVLVGLPNDYVDPLVQLSVALAVPFIDGREYGEKKALFPRGYTKQRPRTELYIGADVGVLVHTGDRNDVGLDLGLAYASQADDLLLSLTLADAYDSRTP